MARPNPVRQIMEQPLPGLTYQRRKSFRPNRSDFIYAYNILNRHIFNSKLKLPAYQLGTIRKAWGLCEWHDDEQKNGSYCTIRLSDKWFYRWEHLDNYGRPMYEMSGAHGPSFFEWREQFDYYGLTLKKSFSQRRWFKHQDFTKC
jgi:hypothetical protein